MDVFRSTLVPIKARVGAFLRARFTPGDLLAKSQAKFVVRIGIEPTELSVSHGRRGYLPCCHRSASAGVSMPRPVDEEET